MKKLLTFNLEHDWKMAAATIAVTLLIMIDRYNNFTDSIYLDRLILYLLVPLFIIIVFMVLFPYFRSLSRRRQDHNET